MEGSHCAGLTSCAQIFHLSGPMALHALRLDISLPFFRAFRIHSPRDADRDEGDLLDGAPAKRRA